MSQLDKPLLPGTDLLMLVILKSVAKITGKFIREINSGPFFPTKMWFNSIKPQKKMISKASLVLLPSPKRTGCVKQTAAWEAHGSTNHQLKTRSFEDPTASSKVAWVPSRKTSVTIGAWVSMLFWLCFG